MGLRVFRRELQVRRQHQAITQTPLGEDQVWSAWPPELAPNPADESLDVIAPLVGGWTPDAVAQCLSRQDLTGIAGQVIQHLVFDTSETQGFAAHANVAVLEV